MYQIVPLSPYFLPLQLTRFESESDAETNFTNEDQSVSSKKPLTDGPYSSPTVCREPTLPHGVCRDKSPEDTEKGGAILHPDRSSNACEENVMSKSEEKITDKVHNIGDHTHCRHRSFLLGVTIFVQLASC